MTTIAAAESRRAIDEPALVGEEVDVLAAMPCKLRGSDVASVTQNRHSDETRVSVLLLCQPHDGTPASGRTDIHTASR